MFGYLTADPSQLEEEQLQRYGSCYCGLCRRLQARHGLMGRMTLTYDMTFLVLVLSSLYEPQETSGLGRCPMHPLQPRPYWTNAFTDYAADLNLLLAWWNCMDDWQDAHSLPKLLLAKSIDKRCRQLEAQYPRQSEAIRQGISQLHRYEAGEAVSADRAADCFGALLGELFVARETDYWAGTLRQMGEGLGRFIYIMDACMDFTEDLQKGHPNPLTALWEGERNRQADYDLLSMLLADGTEAFERLPLEQDLPLLRNILYAGVWQKYNQAFYHRDHDPAEESCGKGEISA